jgi:DNA-binding CsgD family transcriptional regulator
VARAWALPTLGSLRARRGDGETTAPLEEAHALVEHTNELMRIGPVAAARGEAAWLAGSEDAVESLTAAAMALALPRAAAWATGELAYWRALAGVADDLSRTTIAEPYRLAIAGDGERAARAWQRLGCPYEAALALAAGDDQRALRRSVEELQRLGARPAAAIVARRLRRRGVRGVPRGPYARSRENPAGLTARELEVLLLLVEGLRNADIATRLVVAPKTVDHHVSSILRKLDVRSRGEAAAAAARLGVTGS